MNKTAITAVAALCALIAAVLLLRRNQPSQPAEYHADLPVALAAAPEGSGTNGEPLSAAERERTTAFWSLYRQATQEKQAGEWNLAVRDYQQALALKPDHWDSLYYLGSAQMELRRYADAERAYRRLASADSQAERAYSALGALYSNPNAGDLFDLRRAEQEYTLARNANADESGPVLRLGEVALAEKETARAREYLLAAGRTNFKSVNARFLEGYLAWQSGDRPGAEALFRQAIALTRTQPPPAGVLGEGDTRLQDYRAMVRPGQGGLFDSFVAELWHDPRTDSARIEQIYDRVQRFIAALPRPRD